MKLGSASWGRSRTQFSSAARWKAPSPSASKRSRNSSPRGIHWRIDVHFVHFGRFGFASLQFGGNKEFLRRRVVFDAQDVRLAADLAVFDVALAASSGFVNRSGIPFSAGGALKTGFHGLSPSIQQRRFQESLELRSRLCSLKSEIANPPIMTDRFFHLGGVHDFAATVFGIRRCNSGDGGGIKFANGRSEK